jgi:hypothetical protein
MAQKLRPVRADAQKPRAAGGQSLWYRGEERYFDFLLEVDADGALAWFELTIRGWSLSWDSRRRRPITGRTEDYAQGAQPMSKLVTAGRTVDQEMVEFARQLFRCRAEESAFALAMAALEGGEARLATA